uniref:PaREP6 n=1 Tax=Ignisphaera aggregans TaxID=334771 RepID=A0A7J3JPV4_9CREN
MELEEEAKKLRREKANWSFIEKQPPKIRAALKYYIETGDIRRAVYISGVDLEDFRELLRKANIPIVV